MSFPKRLEGIIEVIHRDVPEYFFKKVVISPKKYCKRLIIVSPWITRMTLRKYSLSKILNKIQEDDIETIIFTRPYETEPEYHKKSLELLSKYDNVKIYVNPYLHAKFYISLGKYSDFALFGSANLSQRGHTNYEVGLFIYSYNWGKKIIAELKKIALIFLRLQPHTVQWRS